MARWLGWLCATLAAFSCAAANAGLPPDAEASVEVTGNITVSADGRVLRYDLDKRDRLPPEVLKLLDAAIPVWTFEPIELPPGVDASKTGMGVMVVARPVGHGFEVGVRSATFSVPGEHGTHGIDMTPPRYPRSAVMRNGSGIAYLLLRLGDDGSVADVALEQVNLTYLDSAGGMRKTREELGQAAVEAARKWRFGFDPHTPAADRDRVVRVPVDFSTGSPSKSRYGQWQLYLPGPRQIVPWGGDSVAGGALGGMADGGVYPLRPALQLKTPLGGS